MTPHRRDVLTIAACTVLSALAVVGVVLLVGIDFPPGFGGVPLGVGVAVLFLVRWLMVFANRRRTFMQARKRAARN